MTAASLLIRADASVATGTGHVMRCLALAQAWQDAGGRALFATVETTDALRARLTAESCEVLSVSCVAGSADDASQTIALAREQKTDWVVLDGYQFTADYQRALKAAGFKLLVLDDHGHAQHYSADLVLNQNVCADESLYQCRELTSRPLLGPRYCLLRREFSPWQKWKRDVFPVCDRVLVTMGGSDPDNVTVRVLEALDLAKLENVDATVVVGGSNPHFTRLQLASVQVGRKITVRRDVSNMPELMAEADVAISAAGSTCWELCLLGLPSLLLDVAANQSALSRELDRRGCAIRVGDQTVSPATIATQLEHLLRSHELRQTLSRNCRGLVDGQGAQRVVSILRGVEEFRLRRLRAEDERLLWTWANDPEVRASSFSSETIGWETHVAWFAEKLMSSNSLMLIAEDDQGIPCGQIRFDIRENREADLNISLAKEKRGRGLAVPMIQEGVRELFASGDCECVHAFVKLENTPSLRAFEKAGFARVGTAQVRGHAAVRFDMRRRLN
jgi:UDP-2,4-diacetamido-2,4,6-trideoxy-beta-L-altropyranose hydrolase